MTRLLIPAAAIASTIALFHPVTLHADPLPFLGGPELPVYYGPYYTATVTRQFAVNNAGLAIGYVQHPDLDTFTAVRLDGPATLAEELDYLAIDYYGHHDAKPSSINSAGVVVGSSRIANTAYYSELTHRYAVRWDPGSTSPTILNDLGSGAGGARQSAALLINDAGVIAGNAHVYNAQGVDMGQRAVRWDAGSNTATQLGVLSSRADGYATAGVLGINASGTIVGLTTRWNGNSISGYFGVRWDPGSTTAVELDDLDTGLLSPTTFTRGITDAGLIYGSSSVSVGYNTRGLRPVRWNPGSTTPIELDIINTNSTGFGSGEAYGANPQGDLVGYSRQYAPNGSWGTAATLWNAGSTDVVVLDHLSTDNNGLGESYANDINADRWIVGSSELFSLSGSTLDTHAVVWSPDGQQLIDLNDLIAPGTGWTLNAATSISDSGWVAGTATYIPDGYNDSYAQQRVFLLQLPIRLTGDANNDGVVDAADLLAVEQNFGALGNNDGLLLGDANDDGRVDGADLLAIERHFGSVLQPLTAPVPEPGALVLLLVGMTLAARRSTSGAPRPT